MRKLLNTLLHEGLTPGRAAAAVFVGIFIANVPIYGFQLLAAAGLAVLFGLNKPLTLGATFINNPLCQPFLIAGSVMLGHFLRTGKWQAFTGFKDSLTDWFIGSIPLGAVLGAIFAAIVGQVVNLRRIANPPAEAVPNATTFVNLLFAPCPRPDRNFVRWKLRLDRIFDHLAAEDLGTGLAVDLGCGHGTALALVAFANPGRRLLGCDLNAARIAAAKQAFAKLNADLHVADVRTFDIPPAGLIVILDVLQYLSPEEQRALLSRCCTALLPGGKFIFRVHDTGHKLGKLTLAFDRIIFFVTRVGHSSTTLPVADYRRVLEQSGMRISERRFSNRLPLAHVLFVAEKP